MAVLPLVFIFCCVNFFVNGEVQVEDDSNNFESYSSQIAAVLTHLNSSSIKVYNYKGATLLQAHTKADITELSLDVNVECLHNYPIPCTEKILTCHAFVRNTPGEGSQVLNDVNCKPKPEIVVEEVAYEPPTNPTEAEINETKSIALSNEAVSSEVNEPFVAVRKDRAPCLGCPFDLNPNAEGVNELIALALEHVGSERPNKQALIKVLRLQQQVVAGVKYILVLELGPTVCAKDSPQELTSCPLDSNSESSICQITYLQKPWISKTKHIIANNCTTSQEYVKSDGKKTEMSNEININNNLQPSVSPPNFDHFAEAGTLEELSPSRMSDLESQIVLDVEESPRKNVEGVQSDSAPMPSTVLTQTQMALKVESVDPTPELQTENPETTTLAQTGEKSGNSESSESKSKSSEESAESVEASTVVNHEQASRRKRAIPQLEKISAEEKPLVKNLADFAAAALDNMDDDNHKRIILQILGARKMVGDDGVHYHMIMRMGISHCLEDEPPNPYENCREKLFENYTKICKVQVFVNDDFGSPKLVKSQCQNIKRDKNDVNRNRTNYSRYRRNELERTNMLKGSPSEIDKASELVTHMLNKAMKLLNERNNTVNKRKLVEVVSAESQVYGGVMFIMQTKIAETDCPPNDEKKLEDCEIRKGTKPIDCEIRVWEKLWGNLQDFYIKCDGLDQEHIRIESTTLSRRKRQLGTPGAQFPVPFDDEYIAQYLESSLSHLDSQSEHENKYKVDKILSATSQIVAGQIYRIKAKVVLSDCKKTSETKRHLCGSLKKATPKTCHFKVYQPPSESTKPQTNITCDDEAYSFRRKRDVSYKKSRKFDSSNLNFNMFIDFMKKHNKKYSKKEFKHRFKVFSENLVRIKLLNTYEQGTAMYGVTQFADLTPKEFSKRLGLRPELRDENATPFAEAEIPDIEIPTEFDWRQKGAVTPVKNQEQCGSCWAFSVTGNVEGQYALKHEKLLEFSEQELVDCDTEDQGCNGGLMDTAYRQIEKLGGLETEQDYPYDAEDEKCHFNRSMARVQLSGALNISQDEGEMAKWLVANGPISIAINANAMQFYFGGVSHPFKFLCSPKNLDHGVLIVGYGIHTYPLFNKTLPYWIVKNSWGTGWGEQGYYRVYRGDGTCGLNQTPSSAIVV